MGRGTSAWVAALAVVALSAGACDSPKSDPLPPMHTPVGVSGYDEVMILMAHWRALVESLMADDQVRFEHRRQIEYQLLWLGVDLFNWANRSQVGNDWLDRELVRWYRTVTPGAKRYRGARHRAVALGLLARSAWLDSPPYKNPSLEEMRACARPLPPRECRIDPRARSLRRMVLIGQHADSRLFARLAEAQDQTPRTRSRILDEAYEQWDAEDADADDNDNADADDNDNAETLDAPP